MRLTSEQYKELIGKKSAAENKWHNEKTEVDGIVFDSAKEAKRYADLKLKQRAKLIRDLRMQVSYDIHVKGMLICTYKADFDYWEGGKHIVEDVKGKRLPLYILKKKLMFAVLGIEIMEV